MDERPGPSSGISSYAYLETTCAICLDQFNASAKSFVDSCRHVFCFDCIRQWSETRAVCPLCKRSFNTVLYYVPSEKSYRLHYIESLCRRPLTPSEVHYYLSMHVKRFFSEFVETQDRRPVEVLATIFGQYYYDSPTYFRVSNESDGVLPAKPVLMINGFKTVDSDNREIGGEPGGSASSSDSGKSIESGCKAGCSASGSDRGKSIESGCEPGGSASGSDSGKSIESGCEPGGSASGSDSGKSIESGCEPGGSASGIDSGKSIESGCEPGGSASGSDSGKSIESGCEPGGSASGSDTGKSIENGCEPGGSASSSDSGKSIVSGCEPGGSASGSNSGESIESGCDPQGRPETANITSVSTNTDSHEVDSDDDCRIIKVVPLPPGSVPLGRHLLQQSRGLSHFGKRKRVDLSTLPNQPSSSSAWSTLVRLCDAARYLCDEHCHEHFREMREKKHFCSCKR